MYKYLILFLLLSNSAWSQSKVFYSYSSWIKLPADGRVGYIMGAFDTLIVTGDDPSEKLHKCIVHAKMTGKQLAKNVVEYVATRPQLYGGTVQNALVEYLTALCASFEKPAEQSQPARECKQLFGALSQFLPALCESFEKPSAKPSE